MTLSMEVDAVDGPRRAGRARTARGRDHARPASCRSAPGRGAAPSAADDLDDLGVQIVLGQHLPPDAQARRRRGRAPSAACTASRAGRATCSPTPAATRCSRWRQRRSTTTASRSAPPTTADPPAHARGGGRDPGGARRRHPDGARRVPRCPADRRRPPGRRPHRRLGRPRLRPRAERPDQACSASSRAAPTRPAGRRAPSATVAVDFDGYAIGGLSVGEPQAAMLDALAATWPLPADQPRYLMGVGDPVGMVEAVALGVDLFDCVLPTRLARHGTVLTTAGPLQPRNGPSTPPPTGRSTRTAGAGVRPVVARLPAPPAGRRRADRPRLLTLHNLAWTLALVDEMRGRRWRAFLHGCRRGSGRRVTPASMGPTSSAGRLVCPLLADGLGLLHHATARSSALPRLHRRVRGHRPSAAGLATDTTSTARASTSRAAPRSSSSRPEDGQRRGSSAHRDHPQPRRRPRASPSRRSPARATPIIVKLPASRTSSGPSTWSAPPPSSGSGRCCSRIEIIPGLDARRPTRRPATTAEGDDPTTTAGHHDDGARAAAPPTAALPARRRRPATATRRHHDTTTAPATTTTTTPTTSRPSRWHAGGGPARDHRWCPARRRTARRRRRLPARPRPRRPGSASRDATPRRPNRASGASTLDHQGRATARPVQRDRGAVLHAARPLPDRAARHRASTASSVGADDPAAEFDRRRDHDHRRLHRVGGQGPRPRAALRRAAGAARAQTVQTVSATLGEDSLRAGLVAGFIGLALVLPLHDLYYRALGPGGVAGLCVWALLLSSIISGLGEWAGAEPRRRHRHHRVGRRHRRLLRRVLRAPEGRGPLGRPCAPRSTGLQAAFRTILARRRRRASSAPPLLYLLTVGPVRGFAFFLGLSTILDVSSPGSSPGRWWPARPPGFFTEARSSASPAVAAPAGPPGGGARADERGGEPGAVDLAPALPRRDVLRLRRPRKLWFAISGVVIVIGLDLPRQRGLNLGIDFEGGVVWEVPAGDVSVEPTPRTRSTTPACPTKSPDARRRRRATSVRSASRGRAARGVDEAQEVTAEPGRGHRRGPTRA